MYIYIHIHIYTCMYMNIHMRVYSMNFHVIHQGPKTYSHRHSPYKHMYIVLRDIANSKHRFRALLQNIVSFIGLF